MRLCYSKKQNVDFLNLLVKLRGTNSIFAKRELMGNIWNTGPHFKTMQVLSESWSKYKNKRFSFLKHRKIQRLKNPKHPNILKTEKHVYLKHFYKIKYTWFFTFLSNLILIFTRKSFALFVTTSC